ncbi:MAG: hypothetical protein ABR888_00455 [Thermoplasmata archaeon]|jgi:hypothetical protein
MPPTGAPHDAQKLLFATRGLPQWEQKRAAIVVEHPSSHLNPRFEVLLGPVSGATVR